MVFELRLVIA